MIVLSRITLLLTGLMVFSAGLAGGVSASIYVSNSGNDTLNKGSFDLPYQSIGAALKEAGFGDTIILMDGIYRETNTITSDQITIMAQPGAKPVISGLDTILNWTLHEGNIYKTSVSGHVSQLFTEKDSILSQMVYARYPNLLSGDLFRQTYAIASSVDYNAYAASTLKDNDLSELAGLDLSGAALWLPYPFETKWNSHTEIVSSRSETTLGFIASQSEANLAGNTNVSYHLTGTLSLLDAEEEWYYDPNSRELYFFAPEGVDPNDLNILARTRDTGFRIENCNNVTVSGITFLATGLIAKGNNLRVSECNFYYPTPFFHTVRWNERADFLVEGDGNLVEKCEVAYSWGTGISMRKSTRGTISNCLVHHCNWSGSVGPGIWISGTKMNASGNTIHAMGRSGIRIYPVYNSLFEKNHIYAYGLINHDLGAIKGGLQDYKHTVWRYNFAHDFSDGGNAAKAGIYLDASNDNATVHHNVHYGVHLSVNGNVNHDSIINNTFVRPSDKKVWSHYIRPGNSWDYKSVHTYNNLSTNIVLGTDRQNNMVADLEVFHFAGAEYGDFRLLANSPAIDKGKSVKGINEGHVGNAPDMGAFEFGDTTINGTWIPGITWSPEWNKLPLGEIEVSQDSVYPSRYYFSARNTGDEDGWIMRYDWDFGDGTKAYGKTTSHLYQQNGEFEVSLILRDNLAGDKVIQTRVNTNDLIPVHFQVLLQNPDGITKDEGATIKINGHLELFTNLMGRDSVLLSPGKYFYKISQNGYTEISDSVEVFDEALYLRDTLQQVTYQVNMIIKDQDTEETLSACLLEFAGEKQLTDESGEAVFSGVTFADYTLTVNADNYETGIFSAIKILSDTSLVFHLTGDYQQVQVQAKDRSTGDPVYRASIAYDGKISMTGSTGESRLEKVQKGILVLTIEHADYFTITDSIMVLGDTSLVSPLTARLADMEFIVSAQEGPLDNAKVTVSDAPSVYTGSSGTTFILNTPARNYYPYRVEKEGYLTVLDSIWLEMDTILHITLELASSVYYDPAGFSISLYPNPASEQVRFYLPVGHAEMSLISASGRTIMSEHIYQGPGMLDVSSLPEGLFMMQIRTRDTSIFEKIIITK